MTAATALVASTLTAPPGRSTLATVVMAAAGESTYSRTLWQSTRSAPCSPTTAARSPTSPWTARNCTLISAARRCAAASESGLGSITVTVCPWPARGTAAPPVPPPASTMSSRDRPVSATSPVTTARSTSRRTAVRASSYRFHRGAGPILGGAPIPAGAPSPPPRRSLATAPPRSRSVPM